MLVKLSQMAQASLKPQLQPSTVPRSGIVKLHSVLTSDISSLELPKTTSLVTFSLDVRARSLTAMIRPTWKLGNFQGVWLVKKLRPERLLDVTTMASVPRSEGNEYVDIVEP